jgi:hypothetical protein
MKFSAKTSTAVPSQEYLALQSVAAISSYSKLFAKI